MGRWTNFKTSFSNSIIFAYYLCLTSSSWKKFLLYVFPTVNEKRNQQWFVLSAQMPWKRLWSFFFWSAQPMNLEYSKESGDSDLLPIWTGSFTIEGSLWYSSFWSEDSSTKPRSIWLQNPCPAFLPCTVFQVGLSTSRQDWPSSATEKKDFSASQVDSVNKYWPIFTRNPEISTYISTKCGWGSWALGMFRYEICLCILFCFLNVFLCAVYLY